MKTLLISFTGFLIPSLILGQVAGPFHPAILYNETLPGSSQQWINTGNAAQSDDQYASFGDIADKTGAYTDYLVATNFGFNIPDGVVIIGIAVQIERSDPNSITNDYKISLVREGQIIQTEFTGQPYPVQDSYQTYGSSTYLWGQNWTYKHIDDERFGVAISAMRNSDDGVTAGRIDDIRVTVYYNFTTLPLSLTHLNATKQGQSVLLNWETAEESGMEKFIVERSANGSVYQPIAEIAAMNQPTAIYSWLDASPLKGISYYRLQMEDMVGQQQYSKVVTIRMDALNRYFLYPSPWHKETPLTINNNRNEKLIIYFMNAGGQVLSTAITRTMRVPTETITNRKGLLYYKVFDSKRNLMGSGSLLILY